MNPAAGKLPDPAILVDLGRLLDAYYDERPDPSEPEQRVAFGTSGHRGTSLSCTFNEAHVLAISEAVCRYRASQGIDGPLFLGRDTHALSEPAFRTTLEVLAAHDVDVCLDAAYGYTPTPVISHQILTHNRGSRGGRADGIVLTPSHNPPEDGGFKYNPPHGGPAGTEVTSWIEEQANDLLEAGPDSVSRVPFEQALRAPTSHRHDYVSAYVEDLAAVIDLEVIRDAGLKLAVDPLGGSSVAFWREIASRHRLDITIVNEAIDPTFRFIPVDHDGRIRMDCSSPYAMARLTDLRDRFDVAFANDPDADRHGIVTPGAGLLNPNHHLAACVAYLFGGGRDWAPDVGVGKTVVTSSIIDRVAAELDRRARRGAGRIQVVRRRPAGRDARLRRRGERRGVVPAPRRLGLDDRQGRHRPMPARRRDDRAQRRGPRGALPAPHRASRRPRVSTDRCRRHPGREGGAEPALSRRRAGRESWPASRSATCSARPPATARRSAA